MSRSCKTARFGAIAAIPPLKQFRAARLQAQYRDESVWRYGEPRN